MPRRPEWAHWPDDKLLKLRMKDLRLSVEDTWLESCLQDLYEELEQRDLRIRPHVWLSDEWFSPDTTPGIAIPFYLAHPRLMRLERKKIIDVEGGTVKECMRILRHEAGHVVQLAYQLQRRRKWQKLFGRSSERYPRFYRPDPASKNYVQHLRLWYAQSHPDEDFAETFAIWLTPRANWRKRYEGWPALKKLEYVDELMAEIAEEKPRPMPRRRTDPLNNYKITLADYYKKKQALYAVDTPKTYDRELHRLFSGDPKFRRRPAASTFLRNNRTKIRQMVAKWTGEHQFTLDSMLDDVIDRCRELKLRAVGNERELLSNFIVLLTAKTVHSLYGPKRKQWFAL
jgi:Putative zinc-binding metallo-peptidase